MPLQLGVSPFLILILILIFILILSLSLARAHHNTDKIDQSRNERKKEGEGERERKKRMSDNVTTNPLDTPCSPIPFLYSTPTSQCSSRILSSTLLATSSIHHHRPSRPLRKFSATLCSGEVLVLIIVNPGEGELVCSCCVCGR
jgi:hypothetical protein